MVGRLPRPGNVHDLAGLQSSDVLLPDEEVIEPDMWFPGGKRVPGHVRVGRSIGIDVASVEDDLDRPPADLPSTQPDQRAQSSRELAEVQQLPWRERVEVAGEHMKPALVLRDRLQQGAKLDDPTAFRPCGMYRAEVNTKDPHVAPRRTDLEKRVPGDPRFVPAETLNRTAADESERLSFSRGPLLHPCLSRDRLHARCVGRLLEHDQVGVACADDRTERTLVPFATAADVVGQDSK